MSIDWHLSLSGVYQATRSVAQPVLDRIVQSPKEGGPLGSTVQLEYSNSGFLFTEEPQLDCLDNRGALGLQPKTPNIN